MEDSRFIFGDELEAIAQGILPYMSEEEIEEVNNEQELLEDLTAARWPER